MTNHQQEGGDQGDVLDVRERVEVRERLRSRTCAWCGAEVYYSGVGRPPRYCRASHRKRADEARRGAARAAAAAESGERATGPVREVVERTETVVRTVVRRGPAEVRRVPAVRRSGEPFTLPETPQEWFDTLGYFAGDIAEGRIPEQWRSQFQYALGELSRMLREGNAGVSQPPRQSRAERRRQARETRKSGR